MARSGHESRTAAHVAQAVTIKENDMITVRYYLTDAGKKAHLLAGRTAGVQTIEITDPSDTAKELACVDHDKLVIDIGTYQDDIPDVATMLSQEKDRRHQLQKEKKEKYEAETRKLLELVGKTRTLSVGYGDAKVEYEAAPSELGIGLTFPTKAQKEVRAIEHVQEWLAQLDAKKQEAVEKSHQLQNEINEKMTAAADAAEKAVAEADAAFRQEHGIDPDDKYFPVDSGCMADVPIYESHRRGKNWLAIVSANPRANGGLDRNFLPKCKGKYYYDISDLAPGECVEFGADYYSGSGNRTPKRWYGRVTKISDTWVSFEKISKSEI